MKCPIYEMFQRQKFQPAGSRLDLSDINLIQGFEYEPTPGSCCGRCIQTHCQLDSGDLILPGSAVQLDNCTKLNCILLDTKVNCTLVDTKVNCILVDTKVNCTLIDTKVNCTLVDTKVNCILVDTKVM